MKVYSLIFFIAIFFGMTLTSVAQTDSLKTDKEKQSLRIKGYIGGVYERAPVSQGQTNSFGLQAAVILKNHLQLGLYGLSYANNNYRQRLIFPNIFEMNYKHAGFLLGYRTHLEKDFELNLESKIGFGEVKWDQVETGGAFLADKFRMLHLQVSIDYLLTNFLALNAFFGHRWMDGLDITGLSNTGFNGLNYGLVLKVGKFR